MPLDGPPPGSCTNRVTRELDLTTPTTTTPLTSTTSLEAGGDASRALMVPPTAVLAASGGLVAVGRASGWEPAGFCDSKSRQAAIRDRAATTRTCDFMTGCLRNIRRLPSTARARCM